MRAIVERAPVPGLRPEMVAGRGRMREKAEAAMGEAESVVEVEGREAIGAERGRDEVRRKGEVGAVGVNERVKGGGGGEALPYSPPDQRKAEAVKVGERGRRRVHEVREEKPWLEREVERVEVERRRKARREAGEAEALRRRWAEAATVGGRRGAGVEGREERRRGVEMREGKAEVKGREGLAVEVGEAKMRGARRRGRFEEEGLRLELVR